MKLENEMTLQTDMNVVVLTDILTPYRVFFFDKIAEQLKEDDLRALVLTDKHPIHPWAYEKLNRKYTELLIEKTFFMNVKNAVAERKVIFILAERGSDKEAVEKFGKECACEKIEFILSQNRTWFDKAGMISYKKAEEGFETIGESKKFFEAFEKLWGYKRLIIVPLSASISLNDGSIIKDWQVAA